VHFAVVLGAAVAWKTSLATLTSAPWGLPLTEPSRRCGEKSASHAKTQLAFHRSMICFQFPVRHRPSMDIAARKRTVIDRTAQSPLMKCMPLFQLCEFSSLFPDFSDSRQ
jgi:hypothetical protein